LSHFFISFFHYKRNFVLCEVARVVLVEQFKKPTHHIESPLCNWSQCFYIFCFFDLSVIFYLSCIFSYSRVLQVVWTCVRTNIRRAKDSICVCPIVTIVIHVTRSKVIDWKTIDST
jgi:hypothetical protein